MTNQTQITNFSGRLSLLLAITIFGAANAVTRKLTEIGAQHLIDGRNPISFCNVLFVGNLCALVLLIVIYHRQLQVDKLRQISFKQWLNLLIVTILGGVVTPTLIFIALSITTVNNVILIGQIDTPLVLALSVWLLQDRVNNWVVLGALVSFIGVTLTVFLQPSEVGAMVQMSMETGRGELLVIIAAISEAIANVISRISLEAIPLGIFSVVRMVVGTIVFFTVVIILYGPEHFIDISSPFLWQWMLVYSAVIVVGGQLLWFSGLRQSSASEVSFATSFNPLAGILAAYLILGEAPTIAQYIGGFVILCGIIFNQIGVSRLNATIPSQQPSDKQMSESVSFKGI